MNTPSMNREQIYALRPQIAKSLNAIATSSSKTLDTRLVHLINVRVSQINRCAFCLNMHNAEARRDGETQQRLDVLAAWRDAPFFSDAERSALAFSEALTGLAIAPFEADMRQALNEHFSAEQIIDLTALVLVINSWNRLVAAMGFVPENDDGGE